ncbi:hypothetical protein MRX96_016340 [Rhipicephalus microplus]
MLILGPVMKSLAPHANVLWVRLRTERCVGACDKRAASRLIGRVIAGRAQRYIDQSRASEIGAFSGGSGKEVA